MGGMKLPLCLNERGFPHLRPCVLAELVFGILNTSIFVSVLLSILLFWC